MKIKNILVSGSLVYDRIMNFPGKFSDHILPDKIHILNVSFAIDGLTESFGGTAGNIAYNLSLLDLRPKILGLAGSDFLKYKKWLNKQKIDISEVREVKNKLTASAYIITDKADNQIAGFYQGSMDCKYCQVANKFKNVILAIIAPELKQRMIEYARIYKKLKIPYIFDPGQQITSFTGKELRLAITGSKVLIGNDYEIQLIQNKTGLDLNKLKKITEILVITKGAKGSEIYYQNKKIKIPPARPINTKDPTGAGDAYRAGLIKGILEGWDLAKAGRLASLTAVYAIEKQGTQSHSFNWNSLKKRYEFNFKKELFL